MRKVWWVLAVVAIGLVAVYVAGWLPQVGQYIVEARVGMLAQSAGGKQADSEEEARLAIGSEGGSSLGQEGLKYFFLDNASYEGRYSWGVIQRQDWLVFGYRLKGQDKHYLVVPVRGDVAVRRGSGQEQELVGAQGLEEIIGEARVQLAFLYRFRDAREGERVRQILIERGVGSLGKTKREVEWVMGAFPGTRGMDDNGVKAYLGGEASVVMMDGSVMRLSDIKIR